MEELIKEAEGLYKQIYEIQHDLIKSRLDVCNELTWKAISDMETAMCDTQKILNCIIDRKDNIVDLGEVWHNVNEEPYRTQDILIDSYTVGYYVPTTISFSEKKWSHCISNYAIKRWAYVKDLLPKGGD